MGDRGGFNLINHAKHTLSDYVSRSTWALSQFSASSLPIVASSLADGEFPFLLPAIAPFSFQTSILPSQWILLHSTHRIDHFIFSSQPKTTKRMNKLLPQTLTCHNPDLSVNAHVIYRAPFIPYKSILWTKIHPSSEPHLVVNENPLSRKSCWSDGGQLWKPAPLVDPL